MRSVFKGKYEIQQPVDRMELPNMVYGPGGSLKETKKYIGYDDDVNMVCFDKNQFF